MHGGGKVGLPAAPRGQCSGAQLGSTPAGHTVPKGPRQGRPRPSSPSARPAGEASCGTHSLCVGCRGLVSLGAWVLQKAGPATRNQEPQRPVLPAHCCVHGVPCSPHLKSTERGPAYRAPSVLCHTRVCSVWWFCFEPFSVVDMTVIHLLS